MGRKIRVGDVVRYRYRGKPVPAIGNFEVLRIVGRAVVLRGQHRPDGRWRLPAEVVEVVETRETRVLQAIENDT